MTDHHPILPDVEAFLSDTGMSATYFGKKAVGNSELVSRLRAGQSLHFKTERKVRAFITKELPSKRVPSSEGVTQ